MTDTQNSNDKGGKFFLGAIFGATLGAIGGILFAPKAGVETRKDLTDKANDLAQQAKNKAGDVASDVKDQIVETADNVKASVKQTAGKVKGKIQDVRDDVENEFEDEKDGKNQSI
jgi:gas vesicle protein